MEEKNSYTPAVTGSGARNFFIEKKRTEKVVYDVLYVELINTLSRAISLYRSVVTIRYFSIRSISCANLSRAKILITHADSHD